MKELLILRHAKSSWKHAGLTDHDRPLNKRGQRDAPRMGRWVRRQGLLPDLVVSSTALRAMTTARMFADAAGFGESLELERELYLGGPDAYLAALALHGDPHPRLMVVGHNPDLEELVFVLTGRHESMPTAALAHVKLPIRSWKELHTPRRGKLLDLWLPKELPEKD